MTKLTIGQLAKQVNVNVETIRYYQRIGLIDKPDKPFNGFREYTEVEIERVRFIKRAQQLSFSLAEIKQLMLLGKGNCNEIIKLTIDKRDNIQTQMDELSAVYNQLNILINACECVKGNEECAFFDLLLVDEFQANLP